MKIMLIDKCRIRSIIYNYMQESPYTIQHMSLDVLTERIWEYIERRIDGIVFDIKSLDLNIIVANPAWKRGFEVAINQVMGKLMGEEEDCPVCHGQGATTDHHDPCTECGGSGKVGGNEVESDIEL